MDLSRFALAVGHATDAVGGTGVTVVRGLEGPLRAAVAVTGRATASRELEVLSPRHLVGRADAIVLAGGSAYGLDSAAGVMRWMEERGRGLPIGAGVVPIVPAAAIFDLSPLGRFDARPTPAMAYEACDRARPLAPAEGSVGAGTGATVGKALGPSRAMKGGVGCWVEEAGEVAAAALAVVNAFGDVRDEQGRIVAGARDDAGGFADCARTLRERDVGARFPGLARAEDDAAGAMQHTTLALVATDVWMSREALAQLAAAASVAIGRRITPSGTSFDGDTIFAVCPLAGAREASPLHVEALAAYALEVAVERAVRSAVGRDGVPGLADVPAHHTNAVHPGGEPS